MSQAFGSGFIESFVRRRPRRVLETLLCDRTTGKNIIWADGEYEEFGDGYGSGEEVTVECITGAHSGVVRPRIAKELERQSLRTKSRAEVFTPSWLVNRMNNHLDDDWFGRTGVFNTEIEGGWETNPGHIVFPKAKGRAWHAYVESTRLEITCGEAPFVCSRYDAATGEEIAVRDRVGILDRKLRVVSENCKTHKTWMKWALAALKATYGYEYQGDNLLIARINVFETFSEQVAARWGAELSLEEMNEVSRIISWNFWQMDGLNCAPPVNAKNAVVQSVLPSFETPKPIQLSLFDTVEGFEAFADVPSAEEKTRKTIPLCVIYDWENNEPFEFYGMERRADAVMKKFYAVVGNPPYQAEPEQGSTRSLPLYDKFMDESFKVANHVELVTPARFLFNSGQTKATWNEKILADRHFKVLQYEPDSSKIFSGVDIKGGVAITYRDDSADHEPIGMFIPEALMKGIVDKAAAKDRAESLYAISGTQCNYNFDELYSDHPEYAQFISGEGRHSQLKSNALERVPIFTEVKQSEDDVCIFGLVGRERVYRYCPSRYIDSSNEYLDFFKVVLPASNGSGSFGEVLSSPTVQKPGTGFTQTFMCVGRFDSQREAEATLKYIKTKFVRALLGVLKTTQHNPPITWRLVPLQDFTAASDIDWSQSIADIDQQLYRKYGLDANEVEFIESHVKEMG